MAFVAEFLASKFVSVRGGYAIKRGGQAIASQDYSGAIEAFSEAVAAKKEMLGNRHLTVAQAMAELANAHRLAGDFKQASEVCRFETSC